MEFPVTAQRGVVAVPARLGSTSSLFILQFQDPGEAGRVLQQRLRKILRLEVCFKTICSS